MDKMYIKTNYDTLLQDIKNTCEQLNKNIEDITLVAISKTFPIEDINYLNQIGHIDFGENKVQELKDKYELLKENNIKWHLVGHLQTNKVKYIADFVHLIHSVDTLKLANTINEFALKNNRIIDILVQINTSGEDQKSGIEPDEADEFCNEVSKFNNICLKGLMTIGMFTDNEDIIRDNFKLLKSIFDRLKIKHSTFEYLSMGMTSDYVIALEEGANMLRIGSAIFGYRNYNKN